jgi:hypothetical protein
MRDKEKLLQEQLMDANIRKPSTKGPRRGIMSTLSAFVAAVFALSVGTTAADSITVEALELEAITPSTEQAKPEHLDSTQQNDEVLREILETVDERDGQAETLASFTSQSQDIDEENTGK